MSQGIERRTEPAGARVDEVEVRPAGVDDAGLLALVGAATFLDGFAGVLPGEALVAHAERNHSRAAYEDYLRRPEVQGWLATVRLGGPVGYALLTPPELPAETVEPSDLELKRIYVLSRFHGTGVAQRLMQSAVREAQGRGAARLLLGVHAENARALRFYARQGFQQVGTRQFQVGSLLCDDFVLARPI